MMLIPLVSSPEDLLLLRKGICDAKVLTHVLSEARQHMSFSCHASKATSQFGNPRFSVLHSH